MLGLVGDDQVPADVGQGGGIAPHRAVGRQHEAGGGRVEPGEAPGLAVEAAYGQLGGEPPDLGLPVAEQRGRADDERRAAAEPLSGG